ncbi:AAA family ATPase [Photobacterium sp. ZSDE20]|uniref:AAA family ATPase n=1 Tax=Photobacterium pectinilyticum TaxID=2906793 RepID=A0ABT1N5L7_9GAMM|nr:AAA family ATPase [Photobacterium sp. ZSDE20]MCQ1060001.1 AAA family ATPase [Photobacterium sp. ZSDE20]MDD1826861.1 AAA family ATPase [Photobacterium sp. ZSDE20]
MKLVSLKINNFRAINGEENIIEFKNNNIVFLFGKNNIGKSSVLHAYRYFTSPNQKSLITDFYEQDVSKDIVIEATFLKEDIDLENFANKGLDKWVDVNGLVRFRKVWGEVDKIATKMTYSVADGDFITGGFGGLEPILTNATPNIIYIEAMPSVKSLTDWLEKEIKSKLLKKLKNNHQDEYSRALTAIKSLQEKVENEGYLGQISQKANRYFGETFPDLQLNIQSTPYKEADLSKAFEKDFSITIGDKKDEEVRLAEAVEAAEELIDGNLEPKNTDRKFDLHGHGLIRQAIINILSLFKDTKDGEKHIILFEEPELYLHPSNKRKFRNTLYQIAEQDDYQIICVSHDPQLIDMSREHTSLARFVKKGNGETVIYQAGDNVFSKDDETKDRVLMLNRFNPHICEIFFSDEVILVEGDTEAIVLRGLIHDHYPNSDLFVLNTGTKNNIPFFIEVLSHFRINQHVIHDSDERYLYTDGERRLKKDGEPKANSAWTLNAKIWEAMEAAKLTGASVKRYVSVRNFEHSHSYSHDPDKGKPLSAYEFAQTLNIADDGKSIVNFLKQVADDKPYDTEFTQEYLEEIVEEPF